MLNIFSTIGFGGQDYFCAMLKVTLIAIVMLALAFAGIAIKILVKKNGQFAGTCASNNPMLQEEGASCSVCGARPEEQCRKES
jgi:amino acid permease